MKNYVGYTDEQLALLYVEGDNEAFDELLSRNQKAIYSYILFFVHDPEIANDIFQETFVKVISKLQEGRYTDSGKFSFWVKRIAHNIIVDTYRHQKSTHIVEPTKDNDLSVLSSNDLMDINRENELVNTQVAVDLKKMMESLSEPQRVVVYLRFYQNLSFKEIAEQTCVSINTSLGRMRYALINMRRMARENGLQLHWEL
jgi:RNA polymerase sigma-70 factor (ECF subfamily)